MAKNMPSLAPYFLGFQTVDRTYKNVNIARMAANTDQLFREALDLDASDRTRLLTLLIENLDPVTESDVDSAWKTEIDRRAEQLDSGAEETLSLHAFRGRLKPAAGG